MPQIALHLDEELALHLARAAQGRGVSTNEAAIGLLRSTLGLDVIGDSLDAFVGTWSADDEREVLDGVRWLDRVVAPKSGP